MTIKPLFDKIVIEAMESMDKTQSGIVLPGTAQEKPLFFVQNNISAFWSKSDFYCVCKCVNACFQSFSCEKLSFYA